MGFLVSPGVDINEIDSTNVIPAVSTSIGGYAGRFRWGPVGELTLVSSEKELASTFGAPDTNNAESFHTAAGFLKYGSALLVSRAGSASDAYAKGGVDSDESGDEDESIRAKYKGALGDSLKVGFAHADNFFEDSGDDTLDNFFDAAPGTSTFGAAKDFTNDEVHVIVVDEDGLITGTAGTVLETFPNLSLIGNATGDDGTNIYFIDYVTANSNYIHLTSDALAGVFDSGTIGITATGANGQTFTLDGDHDESSLGTFGGISLTGGFDGTPTTGEITTALNFFDDAENVDVNLLFAQGTDSVTFGNLKTIAESRKDCVAFISASTTDDSATDVTSTVGSQDSSYVVAGSSALYVYDKYNDKNIFIPCSGHLAGLCARTDDTNDSWYSPAGYTRGQLLGVIKLKWNANQTARDELYKANVNPIVAFPGQGIVLFGDKTTQIKPSAFDRINVRRLFITLEKAISTAAKYQLFEFNDEFTRAMFRNMTEPFLRDVKGRRGITDFLVVCDETNNTGDIIDANRFVADIYIKPARSINFITLNFVATRTGIEFDEIVGRAG
jgi:hypothetical protein